MQRHDNDIRPMHMMIHPQLVSSKSASDPLAAALSREAESLAPAFSSALHARIMAGVVAAAGAAPASLAISPAKPIQWRSLFAAAALLGLVIGAGWKVDRDASTAPNFRALTASLRDVAKPLHDRIVIELEIPTQTTTALTADAQRFGHFLAGQLDFFDTKAAPRG